MLKLYLKNKYSYRFLAICFWLLVWEIACRVIDKEIILVSPRRVMVTLFELSLRLSFWQTISYSFSRILIGFTLALCLGIILAVLSYNSRILYELFTPLMSVIKATPVASFIILALMWIHSSKLSILISFLMVVPVIYSNILQGLKQTDEKLLQMAKVFRIGRSKRIAAIYLPTVMPYLVSAVSVGLGFCWKAGIAAEVIGQPADSIGKMLYEAKLYLMTADMLAWTVVIILISILFEKTVMFLIHSLQGRQKVKN